MKKVAWTLLARANAPDAASDDRDANDKPASPTRIPSRSSVKSGHVIENRAGRGVAGRETCALADRDFNGATNGAGGRIFESAFCAAVSRIRWPPRRAGEQGHADCRDSPCRDFWRACESTGSAAAGNP